MYQPRTPNYRKSDPVMRCGCAVDHFAINAAKLFLTDLHQMQGEIMAPIISTKNRIQSPSKYTVNLAESLNIFGTLARTSE